jgi:hypothetical protein
MFIVTSLKMSEYREKATTRNKDEESVQTLEADPAGRHDHAEDFFSLASQYGLEDMEIGDSRGKEQSVEHEYQGYTTAPHSSKTVDLLKFWEVSDLVTVMVFQYH